MLGLSKKYDAAVFVSQIVLASTGIGVVEEIFGNCVFQEKWEKGSMKFYRTEEQMILLQLLFEITDDR